MWNMKNALIATWLLSSLVHGCHKAETVSVEAAVETPLRDWDRHPAIVSIDAATEVYAMSDPHGQYAIFSKLLANNHLIDIGNAPNPSKVRWTGGAAILVIAGDLIDKGPDSLKVIDLVRAIEASAKASSAGRVVTTMGNHEAEFLQDPYNNKATTGGSGATGINSELERAKIDPETLVAGTDSAGRGAWVSNLPFGARIGRWFFAHGGNTQGMSVERLTKKLQNSVNNNGYDDKDITGKDSILEAQKWYGNHNDPEAGQWEAEKLGVDHIVFGHDPGAFGEQGRIRFSGNKILAKLDTAMGLQEKEGAGKAFMLHITLKPQGKDTAEVLDIDGKKVVDKKGQSQLL
jgi:Calcineurin-like phosphoesterase